MSNRECCICGKPTASVRFFFCKPCYEGWFKSYRDEAWLKYLVAQEQYRSRLQVKASNDISLEDLIL